MENKLKYKRKQKGMTQTQLADKANITRPYLSLIENNLSSPSITVCIRLAELLDCRVDDIFFTEVV